MLSISFTSALQKGNRLLKKDITYIERLTVYIKDTQGIAKYTH